MRSLVLGEGLNAMRVLIACCGNRDAGDDAFGPLVARELTLRPSSRRRVVDLSMQPAAVLDVLPGHGALIVVDAVRIDASATGELIDLDWSEARAAIAATGHVSTSSHGLDLADQLDLAQTLGILPSRSRLIGLATAGAAVGVAASPDLSVAVRSAASRIDEWIARWYDAGMEQRHA